MRIALNADVGEGFGPYRLGPDEALFPLITAANIACGFHGGDPVVMSKTVRLAAQHGVGVGAHPGFADREGFGRRRLAMSAEELTAAVIYQIGALAAFARAEGCRLDHVKPHGALYNWAADDAHVAAAIARAVAAVDPGLVLVGLPDSEHERAAAQYGLSFAREGFADRAYDERGRLVPRGAAGAVIRDPAVAARRALEMVLEGQVESVEGKKVRVRVDTLCIHSDTGGAPEMAAALRAALVSHGVSLVTIGQLRLG